MVTVDAVRGANGAQPFWNHTSIIPRRNPLRMRQTIASDSGISRAFAKLGVSPRPITLTIARPTHIASAL